MDDVVNRFARELADAIAAAVAENPQVEACREKARAAGFEMKVTLEAVVGFVNRSQTAAPDESDRRYAPRPSAMSSRGGRSRSPPTTAGSSARCGSRRTKPQNRSNRRFELDELDSRQRSAGRFASSEPAFFIYCFACAATRAAAAAAASGSPR